MAVLVAHQRKAALQHRMEGIALQQLAELLDLAMAAIQQLRRRSDVSRLRVLLDAIRAALASSGAYR